MQRISPFRTLDALRGFAAIWVVMVHCCDRFLAGDNLRYLDSPLYAFAIRGQLGVIMFFVISGYCIIAAAHGALYSGKTLSRYFFERGRRIFPPYWIALIVGVIATLLLQFAEAHHWIAKINHPKALPGYPLYWLSNLTLTQYEFKTGFANTVFWSLCYEVAFYVVVGLLLWIAQLIAKRNGIASGQYAFILGLVITTCASLLTMIVLGDIVFPFQMWHQFSLGGILFYLLEFRQETIAGYSSKLKAMLYGGAAITTVLSIVFIVLRQVGPLEPFHPSSKLRTASCLIFCAFLALIKPFDNKIAESRLLRPLLWVGACSYSLYLIHPVILPFIEVAGRKAGLDGNRYWVNFWIQLLIAVAVGRFFYWLVERRFISSRQTKRLVEEHAA